MEHTAQDLYIKLWEPLCVKDKTDPADTVYVVMKTADIRPCIHLKIGAEGHVAKK